MKKLFILLFALCLVLTACSEKTITFSEITDTDGLKEYYKTSDVDSWQVLAALYLENEDLEGYEISFQTSDSLSDMANTALMCAVSVKLYGESNINTDYITPLKQAVAEPYDLKTADLCLSLMALYAWDITPEVITPAMKHLQEIQLADGGWGEDKDSVVCDPYVSAMVLNVITAYRSNYKDSDSRDGLLTYLGGCITNDNTVLDTDGKSSARNTSAVLSSLIYAGVPSNGEISTALCTALSDFKAKNGFSERKDGAFSETATAEVFLAFSTANRASIFSIFEMNNNQSE